jgi:sirohydrochlorin ferrochelatase
MPHGVQVAQTAHAASEAAGHPPTIVVALSVPDERALREVVRALGGLSVDHHLVVEDSGPFAGQATAVGVVPIADRSAVRKAVSSLPLVR